MKHLHTSVINLVVLLLCSVSLFAQLPAIEFFKNNQFKKKGYFFTAPFKMKGRTGEKGIQNKQLIISTDGKIVAYRNVNIGSDFKIQNGNQITYWSNNKYFVLNNELKVIDSVACIGNLETDSHDFIVLPTGGYILYGKEAEVTDLSTLKIFKNKTVYGSKQCKVKYDVIQQLDKDKKLVYEWRSKSVFKLENMDMFYITDTAKVDVTHFNSIQYNKDGTLLVSCRYFNDIFKLDLKANKVLWVIGQINSTIKITNDTIPFLGQHYANYISSNVIALFDNGYTYDSLQHNARALEYMINEDKKTATLIWDYKPNILTVSKAAGSYQKVKSNLHVINYGQIQNEKPNVAFQVVNDKQEILYSLSFKDTLASYRTFYYEKLPFKLQTPEIKCIKKPNNYLLYATKKYKYYEWSNGSKEESIIVNDAKEVYLYISNDGVTFYRSK